MDEEEVEGASARRLYGFYRAGDFYRIIRTFYSHFSAAVVEVAVLKISE